jgi:tetratricopeptide (TPR) repeat protein
VSTLAIVLLFAALLGMAFWGGIIFGEEGAKKLALKQDLLKGVDSRPLSGEDRLAMDGYMDKLRKGQFEEALLGFQELKKNHPNTPHLAYACALAALTASDLTLASGFAQESIKRGEHVGDAMALSANIELSRAADPTSPPLADPAIRAREFLLKAIEIDPLNPAPHIELAALHRRQGNPDEAIASLTRARNLQFPVDTIIVTELTMALLKEDAGQTTEEPVPPFVLAVRSAKEGDSVTAAMLFTECKRNLPETTFQYLQTDPLVRKFSDQPELKDIFAGR